MSHQLPSVSADSGVYIQEQFKTVSLSPFEGNSFCQKIIDPNSIFNLLDKISILDTSRFLHTLTLLSQKLDNIEISKLHEKDHYGFNPLLLFIDKLSKFSEGFSQKEFEKIFEIFKKFLEKSKSNIDLLKDMEDNTALHYLNNFPFKDSQQADRLVKLFKESFSINAQNKQGQTILHQALIAKNYLLAKSIIENQGDLQLQDFDGNSIFHFFSAKKSTSESKEFLEYLISIFYSQNNLEDSESIPHSGSQLDSSSSQILMPSRTIDDNYAESRKEAFILKNFLKHNPLEKAINQKNTANSLFWLEFALDNGFLDLEAKNYLLLFILNQKIINEQESDKIFEIFKKFYKKFHSQNSAQFNEDTKKSLLIAIAKKGNLDSCNKKFLDKIAKFLFNKTDRELANLYKSIKDRNNNSLLHIFLTNCSSDVEDSYVIGNLNAMIDLKNSQGQTPLMIAISKGFNNFCQKILDKNADVRCEDNQGLNAMHHAVLAENTKMIKKLYESKKYPFLKKIKDRISISEFAVKEQKIQAIKTLFELSEMEIDCQKLGEEMLETKNPQIMRIIMQSDYGDKLFKEFFEKKIFEEIDRYPADDGNLELILQSGITQDFSSASDKFFGKMAKQQDGSTNSPIYYAYLSGKTDQEKIKLLELLAKYQADSNILKDQIVDMKWENLLSCFGRIASRIHSRAINNCLKKIVNDKEFYHKKLRIDKLSVKIEDYYDKIINLKKNFKSQENQKHQTLEEELLKNLKFMQILQRIYQDQTINLSEQKKRSILLQEAIKLDWASTLSLKYLSGESLKKFSFLKNLSDQQLIEFSKNLAKDFLNLSVSKEEKFTQYQANFQKISNYQKKYGKRFSKKIIDPQQIEEFSSINQQTPKERLSTLIDCRSIIKMIGKVTITEQDNDDINKISKKVSKEYSAKPEPRIALLMSKTLSINKAKGQEVMV